MTTVLKQLTDAAHCHSVLCLNGDLPDAAFFQQLALPVIAADGAANALYAAGIQPDIIIGDLDSVSDAIRCQSAILYRPDQESSDFEKCVVYLQEKNLLPTLITGINGGYLDHVLNNVNIFLRTNSIFYAPPLTGFVIHTGLKELTLPVDTKISLLGLPEATLSTDGLKWEMTHARLHFGGRSGCFNRTRSEKIRIHVTHGQLLVMIYLNHIHDAGSEKNYKKMYPNNSF